MYKHTRLSVLILTVISTFYGWLDGSNPGNYGKIRLPEWRKSHLGFDSHIRYTVRMEHHEHHSTQVIFVQHLFALKQKFT